LQPLKVPRVPEIQDSKGLWGKNPIDAFVLQRLKEHGLQPRAPADRRTLIRRLYYSVIGLPPEPEEVEAFVKDTSPDAYEKLVDRLLGSPHYGEHWARHWLDVVRFGESNGFERDQPRENAWHYRNWVIRALNQDLPYDQFIIEQLAGDLLPGASQDQVIATGFLRNSMINEEGAVVPEQFRMVEMFDRMDCLGKAVLGLSTQCAQCHSHKFDPLTQEEYYGIFASLNNSFEAQSWVYDDAQLARRAEVLQGIQGLLDRVKAERPCWETELAEWEQRLVDGTARWQPIVFDDLNSLSGLNHPTQEADLSILMKGHSSADVYFIGEPSLEGVTGVRLELLTHPDLPFRGPGRSSVGTWGVRELELLIQLPGSSEWQKQKLVNATADFSEPDQKSDEGRNSSGPVAYLIDGADNTWWKADRGVGRRNTAGVTVLQLDSPLTAPVGTRVKIVMRMTDMVGCCRVSLSSDPHPTALSTSYGALLAIQKPVAQRTTAEDQVVFAAWLNSIPEMQDVVQQLEALWQQFPGAKTSVLHVMERGSENQRTTHLLNRGNWDQPEQPVAFRLPAAFHQPLASDDPPRLQLSRWLVDRRSPLAARVAVNRVWQAMFGQGLVETAEDFGTRAPVPEYRAVLDWLAVDFMEHGWSTKHLLRRIVSSRVYQQTSRVTPELLELDPGNRLLTRGPRFRADAEVVRDMVMTMAGIIHHQLGGPGVIPPVPQNVLDYNYVYPCYWTPATGAERYRRTVYGFRKRSMPDPSMSTLDAPNADFACARRIRSNTPLAALTVLNEPIFLESAQALAIRILREGGSTDRQRISWAWLLCQSRQPSEEEIQAVLDLLATQRKRIADGWLNVREVTTGKSDQLPALPQGTTPQDAAAWTIAARALLNLDETLNKN
ncbi:MAG: DUF1549 domain-containing protein, partial [Planctomycetaceae bacterium]|nr:DUF1549 domain-containing protein [Planctomycetaceae bacterium]